MFRTHNITFPFCNHCKTYCSACILQSITRKRHGGIGCNFELKYLKPLEVDFKH